MIFILLEEIKNTIKQLPHIQQKEIQGYIGNKPVNIIL